MILLVESLRLRFYKMLRWVTGISRNRSVEDCTCIFLKIVEDLEESGESPIEGGTTGL